MVRARLAGKNTAARLMTYHKERETVSRFGSVKALAQIPEDEYSL